MDNIKILHIDSNHPLLWEQLEQAGFQNHADFKSPKKAIEAKIADYHGIVIRSRFDIDKAFLNNAKNLQFIARVGRRRDTEGERSCVRRENPGA